MVDAVRVATVALPRSIGRSRSARSGRSLLWATAGALATAVVVVVAHASFPADSAKRVRELERGELHFYEQIANREALLESRRNIYTQRIRKLESALRQKEGEIVDLYARISAESARAAAVQR